MTKLLELREALVALKGPLGNVPAFRKAIQSVLEGPGCEAKTPLGTDGPLGLGDHRRLREREPAPRTIPAFSRPEHDTGCTGLPMSGFEFPSVREVHIDMAEGSLLDQIIGETKLRPCDDGL